MKYVKMIRMLLSVICMMLLLAGTSQAALQAVGPTDPITTIPTWYQDTNNLALAPCLDQNGFCLLPPPFDALTIPTSPITTAGPINDANFPGEGFYYSAQAIMPIEAGELANLAYVLEFAFLSGVIPDAGISFLRTDLQKMRNLTPNSTYRVTHPYGTFEFTTDSIGDTVNGGGAIRFEDGSGTAANWMPPLMKAAGSTNIGPFLTRAVGGMIFDPLSGNTYIGDAATAVAVTGGTNGNIFKIDRIVTGGTPVSAQSSWSTDLFVLMGRVFTGQIPSPMQIDRVTYARDAASQQIDVFATALPAAALSISGTGLATTPILQDLPKTGKFFAHIPVAALPTGVTITNSLDIPAIHYPVTLVDEVNISQASFNPVTRNLTIKADSRDNLAPLPILTVPQLAGPNTLDATGTLVKAIAANTIPPMTVTVNSSKGGLATSLVTVLSPGPPPVATADSATAASSSAVAINVLANDTITAPGVIDSATVVIVTAPTRGTAVANPAGTVTYTPPANFTGSVTFTYTVKDNFGQVSNAATVTVTAHIPPAAFDDGALADVNTTVNINVIANDIATGSTINPITVSIVSPPSCGSAAVLTNGTVNFTAPANVPVPSGTCTFSYVVSDTFTPPVLSNVAIVTVAVTQPGTPPLAVNDTATTPANSATVINVIANDTSAGSTLNLASLVTSTPTGGTAVANANGTVTYTAPAVAGSYSFTYTVKDNLATPQTSNAATVTVSVTAPGAPATGVTAVAAPAGTQAINTPVTITASGAGGSGQYEYRFYVNDGGTFYLIQPYSTSNTCTWLPGKAGAFDFFIEVRSAGTSVLRDAFTNIFGYVVSSPAATNVYLSASSLSPQPPNSPITFTAQGVGGVGVNEYRFWLNSGAGFVVAQPYSTVNTWVWTPTLAGGYDMFVEVRKVGSAVTRDAFNEIVNYQIQ